MKSNLIFFRKTSLFILSCLTFLCIQIFAQNNLTIGPETLSFNDGSSLIGQLREAEKEGNIVWHHKDSKNPLSFGYKAVESVLFNRIVAIDKQETAGQLRVKFVNNDFLRGTLISLDREELVFKTKFDQTLRSKLSDLVSIEFLPASYKVFFDSSHEFKDWKKSNSKAWTHEKGSLISVFSGSTGTILPEVDAIEVSFEAEWQRSFYLALRFFSDSDGGSYGSEGYHLSFSNNRINLQSNKKLKGRTVRETLGSVMVDQLVGVKKANFKISAHRLSKEFIVFVNGNEVARWKDSTAEDLQPKNRGILLINQGGNSFLRLEELTIAGWSGESFAIPSNSNEKDLETQFISFKNGDSTPIRSSLSTKDGILIETKRGTFEVPFANLRSLTFPGDDKSKTQINSDEEISLKSSQGKLSFELESIKGEILQGSHPILGKFKIPVYEIKRLQCNLLQKSYKEYLEKLKLAEKELKSQNSAKAISILENTNSYFRSWYWHRLKFLARNSETKEILWFNPHPGIGITRASLIESEDDIIFTNGKDGSYALWDGHAKLADGNFTGKNSTSEELGRLKNEKWKKIFISKDFWLGKTEITQEQFEKIMGNNPSKTKGPNLPAQVNWTQAKEFCKLMNKKFTPPSGLIWRLPTEAEWEYSAKAGSTGPFYDTNYSEIPNNEKVYEQHLNKFGWYNKNSEGQVQPVAQKSPNSWGLFDMHGNVWEWCMDSTIVNKGNLLTFPRFGATNPVNLEGEWKLLKGGSFSTDYTRCRFGYRGANAPSISNGDRGLRICLGPILKERDSNASKKQASSTDIEKLVEKLSPISLQKIPQGSFMMGSRSLSNFSEAICHLNDKTIISGNDLGKITVQKIGSEKADWERLLNGSALEISHLLTKKHLLIGTDQGNVYLLDQVTGKTIASYRDHKAPISCITLDKNEENFVSCGLDGKIVFRDLEKKDPNWIIEPRDYEGDVEYLEFSYDSKKLLGSGGHSNVILIDSASGASNTIFPREKGIVLKAKWLPEKNYFCMLNTNGILSFADAEAGAIYKIIRTNLPSTVDFDLSKNGKKLLLTTGKGSCSLRELPDDSSIFVNRPDGIIEKTPDFYFALSKKNPAKYNELQVFLKQYTGKEKISPSDSLAAFSPARNLILTVHDGALRLWSNQNGNFIVTLADRLASPFKECKFSSDGKSILGKLSSGHILAYPTDEAQFPHFQNPDYLEKKWSGDL